MGTSIVAVEGTSQDIGCNVVLWYDRGGMPFTSNYNARNLSYDKLKPVIKQFCIHWAACNTARITYQALKARRLSANFIIDDDNVDGCATIYQCIPILHAGWSQGQGLNSLGPGVEIAYQPDAWDHPTRYSPENVTKLGCQKHDTATTVVHGQRLKVFLPSEPQMNALRRLAHGFSKLFPDVPMRFPKDANGKPLTTNLKAPEAFTGMVNHFHLKREKIDAAGIDMQRFEDSLLFMDRI